MDNGDHARSALARTARSYFSCCLYYFTVLCVSPSLWTLGGDQPVIPG